MDKYIALAVRNPCGTALWQVIDRDWHQWVSTVRFSIWPSYVARGYKETADHLARDLFFEYLWDLGVVGAELDHKRVFERMFESAHCVVVGEDTGWVIGAQFVFLDTWLDRIRT